MKNLLRHLASSLAAALPFPLTIAWLRRVCAISLSVDELHYIAARVAGRTPCRLLVFGCGNDSEFWVKLNRRGQTIFLENDPQWLKTVMEQLPSCEGYLVNYGTLRAQWKDLLDDPQTLRMTFIPEVEKEKFDCVLVDGPHGWVDSDPGRMKSIYAASRLVRPGGEVLVHDCDRPVEMAYCDRYFAGALLRANLGKLRHYVWNQG